MEPYKNLGGDSGIVAYETGPDCITVQFHDGGRYLYTYESAGRHNVEHMKMLAANGRGLATFINTAVRHRYASKSR